MAVFLEAWGDLAMFTIPSTKTERVSFRVPTPSAARGLLESVMWHPGLRYTIDRIYVLNPIKYYNLKRNEVKQKILASNALRIANGADDIPYIDARSSISQRSSLMLKDVHYVIEAHFDMTDKASLSDNPGKFQDMLKRRLRKGQCYSQPYFGCRECTANVRLWEGGEITPIDESEDLGIMLYDMDYSDPKSITPKFFRARMERGVIDLTDCEVIG